MNLEMPVQEKSNSISELAAAAGMSVKKYRKLMAEAEEAVNSELLRKDDVVKAREEDRLSKERLRLIDEGKTFDPLVMGRRGGVRRIQRGGGTRISVN